MDQAISLLVYPVKDVASAKTLYTALLGTEPYADTPYYVGYRIGDQEIGLDPHGHNKGLTGPLPYRPVDDIRKSLQLLVEAGATEQQAVTDVGGGKLIATITDADGNVTGLVQS